MEKNIYELIYLSRQNDFEALSNLIQYFRPATTKIWFEIFCNTGFSLIVEKEDFFVEADEILLNCIALYRQDMNKSFQAFYKQCIKNRGIDYCRSHMKLKHQGIYTQFSLDSKINEKDNLYYIDLIKSDIDVNDIVINKLYNDKIMEMAKHVFDSITIDVIELKIEGYTFSEICKILNLTRSKVYYSWKIFKKWFIEIDS